MTDITHLLDAANAGDPHAAGDLLPLVYDELRQLAAARLAAEPSGNTLQPTALVHEAFLRLVKGDRPKDWNGRRHFFGAAAEAMRRILIENARRKRRLRHGGGRNRFDLNAISAVAEQPGDDLLALDEALSRLETEEPEAAAVVKMRFFAGLTAEQAAEEMGISLRTANRHWAYSRAWLFEAIGNGVGK